MCVICSTQPGFMPTPLQLAEMSDHNPDGAGVAWHDGETLHRYRNTDNKKVLGFILSNWETLEASAAIIHFRIATHGSVSEKNCHPFRFRGGYAAHNGIAGDFTAGRFASDSRNLFAACEQSGDNTALDSGAEGKSVELTASGEIRWHYGEQSLSDGVSVSNMFWNPDVWYTTPPTSARDLDDDYRAGFSDGQDCATELTYAPDDYESVQACVSQFDYSTEYGPDYLRGWRDGLSSVYGDVHPPEHSDALAIKDFII